MANSITHFLVYVDDLDRAQSFYRAVFGWNFEAWGPPDFYEIYTGPDNDPGVTMGAMFKRKPPNGLGIIGYRCSVSVADIDEAVAAIERHGGVLRSPVISIPELGRVAEFADPEGNVVSIAEYVDGDPRTVRRPRADGQLRTLWRRVAHVSVYGSDFERSLAFYRDVLEFPCVMKDQEFNYARLHGGGVWIGLGAVDQSSELFASLVGRHTGIGIEVEDVDATYETLKAKGVEFSMPPKRQPWGGYMAALLDPDLNVLQLQPIGAN